MVCEYWQFLKVARNFFLSGPKYCQETISHIADNKSAPTGLNSPFSDNCKIFKITCCIYKTWPTRKTLDQTNIPNGALIFMTYCPVKKDIVNTTLHKTKNGFKIFKYYSVPDITECVYVITNKHDNNDNTPEKRIKPYFDIFPRMVLPPQSTSPVYIPFWHCPTRNNQTNKLFLKQL
jgi:hypothetical protein